MYENSPLRRITLSCRAKLWSVNSDFHLCTEVVSILFGSDTMPSDECLVPRNSSECETVLRDFLKRAGFEGGLKKELLLAGTKEPEVSVQLPGGIEAALVVPSEVFYG